MNVMSLFLLSKMMLNLEKISFLPKMNGLFSLSDNAQVISMGVLVILMVILARYAQTLLPSIPQKRILGNEESISPKSLATDLGIIEQSAPVSMRKSNFWYPCIVRTDSGATGSGIRPNSVCFWLRGNSARIDTECAFRRDKPDGNILTVDMFLEEFLYQPGVAFGMGDNAAVLAANIFSGVVLLQLSIRNCLHRILHKSKYTTGLFVSQEKRKNKVLSYNSCKSNLETAMVLYGLNQDRGCSAMPGARNLSHWQ